MPPLLFWGCHQGAAPGASRTCLRGDPNRHHPPPPGDLSRAPHCPQVSPPSVPRDPALPTMSPGLAEGVPSSERPCHCHPDFPCPGDALPIAPPVSPSPLALCPASPRPRTPQCRPPWCPSALRPPLPGVPVSPPLLPGVPVPPPLPGVAVPASPARCPRTWTVTRRILASCSPSFTGRRPRARYLSQGLMKKYLRRRRSSSSSAAPGASVAP